MEATSTIPAARMAMRKRDIQPAPHALAPLPDPTWLQFRHPANDFFFLRLPAVDWWPLTSSFGIHYGTAITACQILACNENGYLSSSRDRHADYARINCDLDSVIPPGIYYYHLSSQESEALYPICCNFPAWKFPHGKLPPAWQHELPNRTDVWPSNWTAINANVKRRDSQCLISQWQDSLNTAHVVPKVNNEWLVRNNMDVYLNTNESFFANSPSNLFALRWDLHMGQFDQAGFVIVPKLGQLVVHFLQPTNQSAQLYHNIQFDHKNSLSHEALYARFAWALMKHADNCTTGNKKFRFLTDGGDEGGGTDEGDSCGGDESGGHSGGGSGGSSGGHGRGGGHGRSRGGGRSGVKRKRGDENEFEQDMKKAALTLPFFVDTNVKASARHYENITWYPGKAIVERRKQAYFDAHPQIRAHSGQLLPDDYNSSDDDDASEDWQYDKCS